MLGWFLWSMDWRGLWFVLGEVRWAWVGAAAAVVLASYVCHALRWKVLLRHVDPDIGWSTLWGATTVMWGFNTLLPLRAGNFLRPAMVAMKRNLPYTTLLFTTIAEYVCDIFAIIAMALWMLALLPADQQGVLGDVKKYGSIAAVAFLLGLVLVVFLTTRRARAAAAALLRPIPSERIRLRLLEVFDQLVHGTAAIGHPGRLLGALLLTLGFWGGWLLGILATLRAFDLALPLAASVFMEWALTLSMLVPQAPGFLGVFQVVTEEALGLFNAPPAKAEAIALVFWTVSFVPITVLGLINGSRMGLSPTKGARAGALHDLAQRADEP